MEVVNGVITLYATYDSDYTTLFTSVDGTDYGRFADLTAEKLVRDGYTFAKFASTTEGADEITSENKCITTLATTIYAIWTADKFVLTVEKNLPELDVIVVGAEAVEGENISKANIPQEEATFWLGFLLAKGYVPYPASQNPMPSSPEACYCQLPHSL